MKKSLAEIVGHLCPSTSQETEEQQQHCYDGSDIAADDKEYGSINNNDVSMENSLKPLTPMSEISPVKMEPSSKAEVSNENVSTASMSTTSPSMSSFEHTNPPPSSSSATTTPPPPAISNLDPRTLDPATLSFITAIITAAASANKLSLTHLLASAPSHLQTSSPTVPTTSMDIGAQQNSFSSFNASLNLSTTASSSTNPSTSSSPNSTFLLPYIVPKSSQAAPSKKRINRGRAFKAHKGIYNVVIDGRVCPADYLIDVLRSEMIKKQSELPPVIVEGTNVCEKLSLTIDLLPHLNNPSHCGAVVAGHLFPRDFFVDHILRDVEGNVKAAKGFINHSNREPLSPQASKLFFDVLYYYGGVIIEPDMLESWMWVARKGVNDRGNTSKSGRGVRYFVKADYTSVLQNDIWASEKSL